MFDDELENWPDFVHDEVEDIANGFGSAILTFVMIILGCIIYIG